jgi:hypothetical protein
MRRDFKFYIGQPITVLELKTRGRVIGYKLDGKNTYVNIAYWMDGKMIEVYLYEDECEPIKGTA